jgi:hypothetical protein
LSSICVAVPGRIHLVSIATLSSAAQTYWMAAPRERVISTPIHRFPSKHPVHRRGRKTPQSASYSAMSTYISNKPHVPAA